MSRFKEKDFENCKYNVFALKKEDKVIDKFGIKYSSWVNSTLRDRNKIFKYIMYLYDPKSPLIKAFQMFDKRQREAANLAGLDYKNCDDLYNLSSNEYLDLVMDFLIDLGSLKWQQVISNLHVFYEYQRSLMKNIDDQITVKEIDEEGNETESKGIDIKKQTEVMVLKSKLAAESEIIESRISKLMIDVLEDSKIVERASEARLSPEAISSGDFSFDS